MAETAVAVAISLLVLGCGYALGTHASLPVALGGLLALLGVAEATIGIPSDSSVPVFFGCVVPWIVGRELATQRRLIDAVGERNRQLEAEEEVFSRLAVQRERARIARELHDIVAHNLAVIVVQAGAGRMTARWEPDVAQERFASIRRSGDETLQEMDRLTHLLSDTDHHGDPDARLRALLGSARAAGLTVRAAPWPPLPPQVADTAYRVVQEALTNAIKHATGGDVDVALRLDATVLRIEVHDSGPRSASELSATGSGSGLDGMRARVEAHGGRLDAGPAVSGGWRVVADLPVESTPAGVGQDATVG